MQLYNQGAMSHFNKIDNFFCKKVRGFRRGLFTKLQHENQLHWNNNN